MFPVTQGVLSTPVRTWTKEARHDLYHALHPGIRRSVFHNPCEGLLRFYTGGAFIKAFRPTLDIVAILADLITFFHLFLFQWAMNHGCYVPFWQQL